MGLNTAASISFSQINSTSYFTNGNLGINTTNPTANLDVAGTIKASGLSSLASITTGTLSATDVLGNSISAGTLSATTITGANLSLSGNLSVAGTLTTVNITSTNILNTNISVGTINATGFSSLQGISANSIRLESETITSYQSHTDAGNLTQTYIAFGPAGANTDYAYLRQIGGDNAYKMSLDIHDDGDEPGFCIRSVKSTDNPDTVNERFTVQASGNVGIGINNPSANLDVAGTVKVSGTSSLANVTATNVSTGGLNATGLSTLVNVTATNVSTGGLNATGLSALANVTVTNVSTGGLNATGLSALANATVTNVSAGVVIASTSLFAVGNSNTVGSIYTTGGNVGIGITNPSNTLQIGNATNTTILTVTSSGSLGIGTSTPESGFSAYTIPNAKLTLLNGGPGTENIMTRLSLGSGSGHYSAIEGGHLTEGRTALAFMTCLDAATNSGKPLTRMYITNDGTVGINTTSPSATLDVTGTARFTTSVTSGLLSATNIVGTNISAGTLSAPTITGANLSLSGDLIIGGTLTTVNITSTNILNTNISAGTINATGLSSLQNVTLTNASVSSLKIAGNTVMTPPSPSDHTGISWVRSSNNTDWYMYNPTGSDQLRIYNGSDRMTFASSGNVGVGTNSPAYTLDVAGTGRFSGKLTITGSFGETGFDTATHDQYADMRVIRNSTSSLDKDMYIQNGAGATSTLHMYSNNSETMTLKDGRVGINQSTPAVPLTFSDTLGAKISLYGNNTTANYGFGIQGGLLQIHSGSSSADIAFGYGASSYFTERMRIKGSGNVGIGTITPSYTLDVNGTIHAQNELYIGTASSTGTIYLGGGASGDGEFIHSVIETRHYSGSESSEMILFKGNDIEGGAGPDRIRLRGGAIAFDTYSSPTSDRTAENIRMYINSSGNVGIGTVSPSEALDVRGNIRLGPTTDSNADYYIKSAGQLTISANDSSSQDSTYTSLTLTSGVSQDQSTISLFGSSVAKYITMSTANTERLRIDASGNVGIGTTSPSGMLHLNNAALFTSTGNLTCTGDVVSFGSLSDRRLKKNIETIQTEKALDIVSKLRAVSFDWKEDIFNEEKRNTSDLGFIAQEVEALVPEAVSEYKEVSSGEVYKNIKHERLVPYLLSAIQYLLSKEA